MTYIALYDADRHIIRDVRDLAAAYVIAYTDAARAERACREWRRFQAATRHPGARERYYRVTPLADLRLSKSQLAAIHRAAVRPGT